ncbi:MAG: hypothetical protein R3B13_17835 [Polyangiaceae bacterium]
MNAAGIHERAATATAGPAAELGSWYRFETGRLSAVALTALLVIGCLTPACTCSKKVTVLAEDEAHDVQWVSKETKRVTIGCAGGHGFGICFPTKDRKVVTEIHTPKEEFSVSFSCGNDAQIQAEPGLERFAMKCGPEKWGILYHRHEKTPFLWPEAYASVPDWKDVPPLHEVSHLVWPGGSRRELVKELRETEGDAAIEKLLSRCPDCPGSEWGMAYDELDDAARGRVRAALLAYLRDGKSVTADGIRRGFVILLPTKHAEVIPAFTRHLGKLPPSDNEVTDALIGLRSKENVEDAGRRACERVERGCGRGCDLALAASKQPCAALSSRLDRIRCASDALCDDVVCDEVALEKYWQSEFEALRPRGQLASPDARLLQLAARRRGIGAEQLRSIARQVYASPSDAPPCRDAPRAGARCQCDGDELRSSLCKTSEVRFSTEFCDVVISDKARTLAVTATVSANAKRFSFGSALCVEMADGTVRCASSPAYSASFRLEKHADLFEDGVLRRDGVYDANGDVLKIPAEAKVAQLRRDRDSSLFVDKSGALFVRFPQEATYQRHDVDDVRGLAIARGTACILQGQELSCWGPDKLVFGESRPTPHSLGTFDAVSGEGNTICARSGAGRATCWKNGKTLEFAWPHHGSWVASSRFVCALDAGKVWCADLNDADPKPREVTLPESARELDLEANQGCALLASGKLSCWSNWDSPSPLRWHDPKPKPPLPSPKMAPPKP